MILSTSALAPDPGTCDDVATLRRYIQVADFPYIDVHSKQSHQRVLERWPLLQEVELSGMGGSIDRGAP